MYRYSNNVAWVNIIESQLNFDDITRSFHDDRDTFDRKLMLQIEYVEAHMNFRRKLQTWYPHFHPQLIDRLDGFLKAKQLDSNTVNDLVTQQQDFVEKFQSLYQEFAQDQNNFIYISNGINTFVNRRIKSIYGRNSIPSEMYSHIDWSNFEDVDLLFDTIRLSNKTYTFVGCFKEYKKKNSGWLSPFRSRVPFSCPNLEGTTRMPHLIAPTTLRTVEPATTPKDVKKVVELCANSTMDRIQHFMDSKQDDNQDRLDATRTYFNESSCAAREICLKRLKFGDEYLKAELQPYITSFEKFYNGEELVGNKNIKDEIDLTIYVVIQRYLTDTKKIDAATAECIVNYFRRGDKIDDEYTPDLLFDESGLEIILKPLINEYESTYASRS